MLESMAIVWSCHTWHSPQFIQQCKGILSAAMRESPQNFCSLVCETGHKFMGSLQHIAGTWGSSSQECRILEVNYHLWTLLFLTSSRIFKSFPVFFNKTSLLPTASVFPDNSVMATNSALSFTRRASWRRREYCLKVCSMATLPGKRLQRLHDFAGFTSEISK